VCRLPPLVKMIRKLLTKRCTSRCSINTREADIKLLVALDAHGIIPYTTVNNREADDRQKRAGVGAKGTIGEGMGRKKHTVSCCQTTR